MRVCTLIVRLLGFYLLLYSTSLLMQVGQARRVFPGLAEGGGEMALHFGTMTQALQQNLQIATWGGAAGIGIGAMMAIFAATCARLLTCDVRDDS
jgi:hypothetical protein